MKPRTSGEPGGDGQAGAGPRGSSGGEVCRPGEGDECGALQAPAGGAGGTGAGPPGDGGQSVPEFTVPSLPTAAPPAPGPDGVVLPPLTAPGEARSAAGESRMTLMSPTALSEQDETDWAIVIGIALVAEIGLLWGAACVGLWRRRIALYRAASRAAEAGQAMT